MLVHASCVLWKNKGILLLGNSGSGKSTAALRLIEKGAVLIADDYIELSDDLNAVCPDNIFGKIEVRGVGICSMPAQKQTQIHLAIQCTTNFNEPERIPPKKDFNGAPLFTLCPFDYLFCTKVELLLEEI